jgi:HAE1 family hydrophobic/amphiphilic exporter-1
VTISFDLLEGYALSDAVRGIDPRERKGRDSADDPGQLPGNRGRVPGRNPEHGFAARRRNSHRLYRSRHSLRKLHPPAHDLVGPAVGGGRRLLTLYVVGLPLTLYAFVGMVMLIGIVKKNAIMMVDFAISRQRAEAVPPSARSTRPRSCASGRS